MSTIKVNTVTKRTGSTLTLGESGATVTLACGASQSGFGRTGTVDWCTTAKTAPFTAVSGDGFFVNTTSGAITVTLPASPSAGDIVAFKDYAGTWATACKAVTVNNNGSKINCTAATATLNTANQAVTLIYVDGTKGWQSIQDDSANVSGASYISATGGTITTSPCGDFKIHTFTANGCFAVSAIGSPGGGGDKVSYVVVGGGGGGGGENGTTTTSGGGGAGGYREGKDSPIDSYTASPLAAADSGLPVTVQTYPITVGGGGAGGPDASPNNGNGTVGVNSTFSSITAAGGGFGSGINSSPLAAGSGGSGGGGKQCNQAGPANGGGVGNTPPVSPPQGNNGGKSNYGGGPISPDNTYWAGGGGGAGAVGGNPASGSSTGPGGAGVASSITGSPVTRAGGGGAGKSNYPGPASRPVGLGGAGGGGAGQPGPGTDPSALGTANTGGGGGGGAGKANPGSSLGGTGGSGVVIIRYKFQS